MHNLHHENYFFFFEGEGSFPTVLVWLSFVKSSVTFGSFFRNYTVALSKRYFVGRCIRTHRNTFRKTRRDNSINASTLKGATSPKPPAVPYPCLGIAVASSSCKIDFQFFVGARESFPTAGGILRDTHAREEDANKPRELESSFRGTYTGDGGSSELFYVCLLMIFYWKCLSHRSRTFRDACTLVWKYTWLFCASGFWRICYITSGLITE